MPNRKQLRTQVSFFAHGLLVFIAAGLLAAAASGCGRKGPPKPPEDFAPLPVKSLSVTGTVEGLVFSWSAPDPDLDQKDEDIIALDGFIFQRSPFVRDQEDDFDALQTIPATEEDRIASGPKATPTPTPEPTPDDASGGDSTVTPVATPTPTPAPTPTPVPGTPGSSTPGLGGSPSADATPVPDKYTVTDKDVLPGRIYDYQVLPVNEEGGVGEASQTLRVTYLGEHSRIEHIQIESTRKEARTVEEVDTSDDE